MAAMLGRFTRPWCPSHRRPAGLDCPDASPSKRSQRAAETRQWRRDADAELTEGVPDAAAQQ